MIERIELKDFQCHSHLSLDFDKITTLVGASDSGKTAILRALDWVCFNRGRTALLLRRGCNNMTVKLNVDGKQITRTTKQNSYWIDKQQLSTIGKTLPPEVSNIMRMVDENVQRQHDYLFWFACNGSGLVQQLNRIVDLTELDGWVREGIGRERKSKEKIESKLEERREIEDRRDALLVNVDADRELKVLEEFTERYENDYNRVYIPLKRMLGELSETDTEISGLSEYIRDLTQLISFAESIMKDGDRSRQLGGIVESIETADQDSTRLSNALSDWRGVEEGWLGLQGARDRSSTISSMVGAVNELVVSGERQVEYIADVKGIVLEAERINELRGRYTTLTAQIGIIERPLPDIAPIVSAFGECIAMSERYGAILGLADKLGEENQAYTQGSTELTSLRSEFEEKLGGVCPICGGKINDRCIND